MACGAVAAALVLTSGGHAAARRRVVARFGAAWAHQDWRAMYGLLTPAARRRVAFPAFRAAYVRARRVASETTLAVGRPSGPHAGRVALPVAERTRLFGTLHGTLAVPVTDAAHPRLAWTPALTIAGLRPGEHLSRHVRSVPRASILAADGRELHALGHAGTVVAGTVRTATSLQRALGRSTVGSSGLEMLYDRRLAGRPGATLYAGARVLAHTAPRRAQPLRTTIDPALQAAAVSALEGRYGGIAVLDPTNGDVLALAGIALSAPQPPGSTFKIITTTGVLAAGLARPDTVFAHADSADIGGFTLHNDGGEVCGGTLTNAFAVSCNSVFAPLGVRLGARRLVATARRYGFDEPSRLPDAAPSTIPPADQIGGATAVGESSIGQGRVLATPLVMADVAATIAHHGRRPVPRLLASLPVRTRRVTSPEIAGEIRTMMLAVVERGTGTAAQIPGVRVAGKTGTAELAPTTPGATTDDNDAWFVAFAPARRPTVAVAVLRVRAGAGGADAAPIARRVLLAAVHPSTTDAPH